MATMQVETYEVPEISYEGEPECEAEAMELIERLGLDGQKALVSSDGQAKARCPYRKMTAEEAWVYGKLLTKQTPIDKYSDGPIPLRVLQVAAHAVDLFDEVVVWHPENADIKDPILVGKRKDKQSSYNVEQFLLARWGDVLEPLAKLKIAAAEAYRSKVKAECLDIAAKVKVLLASAESVPADVIAAGGLKMPSYYTS